MSEPEASESASHPLTELLGIRYPVVQAAMGYVSGPRLAAAVSDAGRPRPDRVGHDEPGRAGEGDRGDGGADSRDRSG